MAVFRPDLAWSTYQEKQLVALESIEKSINFGNQPLGKLIASEFDDSTRLLSGAINAYSENNIRGLRDIATILYDIDDILKSQFNRGGTLNKSDMKIFDMTSSVVEKFTEDIKEAIEEVQEEFHESENTSNPFDDGGKFDDFVDKFDEFTDKLIDITKKLADKADGWSDLMNETIRVTGADMKESQTFRRSIVKDVSNLNDDIGKNLYNPERALSDLIAISNNTGISNREVLQEFTEPMLLAQETMNINTGNLAEMFNKYYVRTGFEASNMESLLGEINKNSNNSNMTAEELMQKSDGLATLAASYINPNMSADEFEKFTEEFSGGLAYLANTGMDPDEIYNRTKDLYSQNSQTRMNAQAFFSMMGVDTSGMYSSSNIGSTMSGMWKGVSDYSRTKSGAILLGNSDFSVDDTVLAGLRMANFDQSYEDWLSSREDGSLKDQASEKYINWQDRVSNEISEISSYLGTIQETLGIGFSDVAGLLYISKSFFGGSGKGLASVLGRAFSSAGLNLGTSSVAGFSGTGLAGALSGLGGVLGIGAATVGIAGLVDMFYDKYKENEVKDGEDSEDIYNTDFTASGALEDYSSKQIESANFSLQNMKDQYKNAGAWNIFTSLISGTNSVKDDWYDYIPFVGKLAEGINGLYTSTEGLESLGNTKYANTVKNHSDLWNLYKELGLVTEKTAEADMKFFATNIDRLEELYSAGRIPSAMNLKGLNNPKKMKGYAVGTNYIDKDQLAMLHEGEAVVPAKYNPSANMNELERLRKLNDTKESDDLTELIQAVKSIEKFLKYWRTHPSAAEQLSNRTVKSSSSTGLFASLVDYAVGSVDSDA